MADQRDKGVSFSLSIDIESVCAGCKRPRDIPEGGGRFPVRGDESIAINADSPCECGSTRIKLRPVIG